MAADYSNVLFVAAFCAAVACGWLGGGIGYAALRRYEGRKLLLAAGGVPSRICKHRFASSGWSKRVLGIALSDARKGLSVVEQSFQGQKQPVLLGNLAHALFQVGSGWFFEHVPRAGLKGELNFPAYAALRLRFAGLGLLAGGVLGSVGSLLLAGVLGIGCGMAGFCLPRYAIRSEERARQAALDRELPQMLQVVCLGLRSGLSFEQSFQLYHGHFDSVFADECRMAQQSWSVNACTMDDALADLSGLYGSVLLERVAWTIRRSTSLGTSLAEGLEACSRQICDQVKKSSEERVAKASVKMLVPTAALILPAMLLLVMGPILLELLQGF